MIDIRRFLPFIGNHEDTQNPRVPTSRAEVCPEGKAQKEIRDFREDIANSNTINKELTDDVFEFSKNVGKTYQKDEIKAKVVEKKKALKQAAADIDKQIKDISATLEKLPKDSPVRKTLQAKLSNLYKYGNVIVAEYEKLENKYGPENIEFRKNAKEIKKEINKVKSEIENLPEDSYARTQLQERLENLYMFYFKFIGNAVLN